jgi:hypothetical protein
MPAEFACWLSRFSDEPCDGQIVKCHLIPQQKLKRIWNEVYHAKRLPTLACRSRRSSWRPT